MGWTFLDSGVIFQMTKRGRTSLSMVLHRGSGVERHRPGGVEGEGEGSMPLAGGFGPAEGCAVGSAWFTRRYGRLLAFCVMLAGVAATAAVPQPNKVSRKL